MFILDTSNYRILQWQAGDPIGYVIAGGNGNGGAFTQIGVSYAMFVDSQYNIYISESSNARITKWTASNVTAGVLVIELVYLDLFLNCYIGCWWQWSWQYTRQTGSSLGYFRKWQFNIYC